MIHTLDIQAAPQKVSDLIRQFLARNDFLYLTRNGIPCVVLIPIQGGTHHNPIEVSSTPTKLPALIELVEEQGETVVLSRSGQPLIALVPYHGSLGRKELEAYRHRLKEKKKYNRCVSEWGYDPDFDE